jgi:lytic murein transglycosylase
MTKGSGTKVAGGGPRSLTLLFTALACALLLAPAPARADFQKFLVELWPEAQKAGVSQKTFEAATAGLTPDMSLPELAIPGRPEKPRAAQAEFVQRPADYMAAGGLAALATRGQKLAGEHRTTLAALEKKSGVPGSVLLAVWARETNYGAAPLRYNAIRVLATHAYTGRRRDYFRAQLLYGLKILEAGDVSLAGMKSSWAGAMGQTQFMPYEFFKYGADFDGDGRRDIWNSVPDALASTANQLLDKGWRPGKGWAYEVEPPGTMDCTEAEPERVLPVRDWLKRGFRPAGGRKIADADLAEPASLFLPAGTYGPAFLTLKNFYVIKSYNFADLYALYVGHLGDRIAGRGGFARPWNTLVQLKTTDLEAMQKGLAAAGLYTDKVDGKAGQKTRVALGAFEKANGLTLDCWPDAEDLARMRKR